MKIAINDFEKVSFNHRNKNIHSGACVSTVVIKSVGLKTKRGILIRGYKFQFICLIECGISKTKPPLLDDLCLKALRNCSRAIVALKLK